MNLDEVQLFGYNVIDNEFGRWSSYDGRFYLDSIGIPWVPILGKTVLPNNMETMKAFADGNSALNPSRLREGIVYRGLDGKDSFKNVSNLYLLNQGKLKPKKKVAVDE